MFLCTSPNFKDWNINKKLLLLGSWCINNDDDLTKLNYELLPYHWKNNDKFQKDFTYLYQLYEDIIPEISKILNNKNKKNFSSRYWETLIGPWLWNFIQVLFDRYSSILQAVKQYENLETWITDISYSPKTFLEFENFSHEDKYNFIIFSQIINNLNLPIKVSKNKINLKYFDDKSLAFNNEYNNKKNKYDLRILTNYSKLFIKNMAKRIYSFFFTIIKGNNDFFS